MPSRRVAPKLTGPLMRGFFYLLVLFSIRAAFAQEPAAPQKLLPQPREVTWKSALLLQRGVRVIAAVADAEDRFTAEDLRETFKSREIDIAKLSSNEVTVELLREGNLRSKQILAAANVEFAEPMQTEGYAIVPTSRGLAVIGATAAGVFYGAQTVKQLIMGSGRSAKLETALIRDWPALRYRGMDDDLSRGPVPTLEFQKKQIRTFAEYKLNIYSPYFENTFRYSSNPLPASPGGAMTPEEYVEFCRYAELYHVTVVPEQEAIGHLHNVLSYEQFADLAETPHGSVLAPGNPAVIPLVTSWFTELAAVTPGPFLHLGGDETFDLGKGKTRDEVERRGLGQVYIDFLKQIDTALQPLHKRILFWGDVAMNEPKLVSLLPKDMIAVPWTYDLSPTGYKAYILPFTKAGMETWVAPGVSNWNRIYPDYNIALSNIQGFIRDGQALGSTGALTTAWNDDGEGLFNEDWYGVLFGAAASWQPGESSIPVFENSYGEVFHGDMSGRIDAAQKEIMLAHALLSSVDDRGASDALFWVDPWSADGRADAAKLRPMLHELRYHAERALVFLADARKDSDHLQQLDALSAMELSARRIDIIGLKFQFSDEIIDAYSRAYKARSNTKMPDDVDSDLYEISDTNGRCQDIRNAYSLTRDLYEQAWLRENRPFWLHNVLARYDLAIQLWTQRGNAVAAALNQWHRDHTLPEASALGIPSPVDR